MNNLYQRQDVTCEICDETQSGTVVNITPKFCICDECLTMMDMSIALEVIGSDFPRLARS